MARLPRSFFVRDAAGSAGSGLSQRKHPRVLSREFFRRDADVVARDLLGRILVHAPENGPRTAARIVETEAYFGPPGANPQLAARADMPARLRARLLREGDPASHAFRGPTKRNRAMFGIAGVAYVYLIYGMHECLNVTTGPEGAPQAVLLRAGEPVEGIDAMRARRPAARKVEDVASGPGKLAAAMGVTRALDGGDMTAPPLWFEDGARIERVETSARIGVAGGEELKLRFAARGSAFRS